MITKIESSKDLAALLNFGYIYFFISQNYLSSSNGFWVTRERTCHKLKQRSFGCIIEYIVFIDDIVESPVLGKLTWTQKVLYHNPHDTQPELLYSSVSNIYITEHNSGQVPCLLPLV